MLSLLVNALWLMLPAYFSNSSAVLFAGKTPIDFGKNFIDGKRIFGAGKTFKGLIGGTLLGITVGLLQQLTKAGSQISVPSFDPIFVIVTLSFGAMLGDLAKSFVKRRFGIDRGRPWPIADQFDFVVGAWILTYLFFSDWFVHNFTPAVIAVALILSPLLHLAFNQIGYRLGKKREPW
ncbi:MAG TPA: CDP-2,3-bis-(O-geranylgeranyl)-sn-glycerol synthase [Candidatus Acidoferrales bacterium]|nr:CDP-2,3-bis-(O-geranylgeranyl)-sn-glycerol synthase [Candidatus Acidoferrales bacterium]